MIGLSSALRAMPRAHRDNTSILYAIARGLRGGARSLPAPLLARSQDRGAAGSTEGEGKIKGTARADSQMQYPCGFHEARWASDLCRSDARLPSRSACE